MNMRIVLPALFLLLLTGGCIPASASPGPDIMPRLDPSPTASGSTLPLTCQVTDLNVYINEAGGYCFAYPTRFTLGDQPGDNPGVRGPDLDDSLTPTFATFGVHVELADPGQTLPEQAEAYLREVSTIDPATYTWSRIQVGGETGWMIEPVPSIGAWRIVFVLHGGNLFRLMYWPVDNAHAKADVEELTQTTLGSFAFLK